MSPIIDLCGFASDILKSVAIGGNAGRNTKSQAIRDAIELAQEALEQLGKQICDEEPPTLRTGVNP